MTEKKENIVKATAKALGMKYKQLGEAIGYSEETIRTVASSGKVSDALLCCIAQSLKMAIER